MLTTETRRKQKIFATTCPDFSLGETQKNTKVFKFRVFVLIIKLKCYLDDNSCLINFTGILSSVLSVIFSCLAFIFFGKPLPSVQEIL